MSWPRYIGMASVLWFAAACGADDSPGGAGQAGAGAGGSSPTGGTMGTSGASAHAGSNNAGASAHAGSSAGTNNAGSSSAGTSNTSGAAGTGSQAGSGGSAAEPLSEACQEYCDCHEENCATTPIPGGKSCGDFCAAMTEEQLDCRLNMCSLVPAQPDNDHCDHSVGIDQCE